MKDRYEKTGRSIRLERARDASWIVESTEGGVAESDGTSFVARSNPPDASAVAAPSRAAVEAIERRIAELVLPKLAIERLTIVAGHAAHRFRRGRDSREWSEQSIRAHLSIVNRTRGVRITLDAGSTGDAALDLRPFRDAIRPLERVTRRRGARPPALRLAPVVAAELWPSILVHPLFRGRPAPGVVALTQQPPSAEVRDGVGDEIRTEPLVADGRRVATWPNVFRPSYRIPPRPAPVHVFARAGSGRLDRSLPVAVAVVAPFEADGDSLRATFLVEGGSRHAHVMRVALPVMEWLERIERIATAAIWTPVGGGSWGAETLLVLDRRPEGVTRRRR